MEKIFEVLDLLKYIKSYNNIIKDMTTKVESVKKDFVNCKYDFDSKKNKVIYSNSHRIKDRL